MNTRGIRVALTAMVVAIACQPAGSHEPAEETVTPLQRRALPDVPGRQAVLALVAYRPGEASAPHRHAGSVIAYVLEGEVISQLEGQPAITYKAGQSWYEPPRVPHLVSRNASATKPARLLAWLLMEEGGEVKEALPK